MNSFLKYVLYFLSATAILAAGFTVYRMWFKPISHLPKPTCQRQIIPRTVLFGNPEKTSPQISPDGKKVAYLAPVNGVLNIWVKTVGKNDDHPITKDTDRGVLMSIWAYNNKHLLYVQDNGGDENWHLYRVDLSTEQTVDLTPFKGITLRLYAINKNFPDDILIGMNKENPKLFDVYHLNIVTGTLELREKNPGNVATWVADSNLNVRAATTFNDDGGSSLLLRTTEKDAWKTVITWNFEDTGNIEIFGFSHDGKKLYLKDSFKTNTTQLIEYNCTSGHRTILAKDPIFDVKTFVKDFNEKPLAVSLEKERCTWIALDKNFKSTLQAMQAVTDGDLSIENESIDNLLWVIGFIHDDRSNEFYLFDTKTQKAEFLFATHPKLNKYQLAHVEPISFIARDGLKIYGYLACPPNKQSKNLPLVLFVHGGPWGRDTWATDANVQWFANRGYACLQVNFRGSIGYGKAFLNAGNHEWAAKMHDDLIDGVNWAVAQGIANPKKIAIVGGSYGGYAALVGATFTPDVFCCAVDMVGPSNLVTLLLSIPPYWISEKKQFDLRLGDPKKDVAFLKSRSPLFKADNIKIPILIAQGANDPRVNQAESEQIVAAMKAKNLPYEYILFPDEGHGFAKPENRLKFYAIAEKFLAKHMGEPCLEE